VFSEMQERFQPERAQNADAKVQWVVRDAGEEHRFAMEIAGSTCSAERGEVDSPRVTLSTDLAPFAKLVTGKEGGPTLFMRGQLQVSGDLFYAQRITGFFDQPG
jgi:putative sterol carrier protein